MRRIAVFAVLWVLVGCQRRPAAHQSIGDASAALHAAFDADAGKVRLVLIASPTDEASVRRAKLVAAETFLNDTDPRLAAYVVWSSQPESPATEDDVAAATQEIRDPRAHHFWDASGGLFRSVQTAQHLPAGRDVYLVYGASAHWEGATLPSPSLSLAIIRTDDQQFDVAIDHFAGRVQDLLKDAPPATQPAGPTRHP